MIFFDMDSAYVYPGFPSNIDMVVPNFIKRFRRILKHVFRRMA